MTTLAQESLARLEVLFGHLLVGGVLVSSALLAVGLLLWAAGLEGAWDQRLLNAGLLALMATPVIRVVVSAVEYTRRGDWFFVATSLAVLAVLALTMVIAFTS